MTTDNKRRSLPLDHFLRTHEVSFEFEALVESDERAGRNSLKADFYVYAASSSNAPELAIEAKPLENDKDISRRYLTDEGIGCFVTSSTPYTQGPLGAMLSYKLDNPSASLLPEVNRLVSQMQPIPLKVSEIDQSRLPYLYFYSHHHRKSDPKNPVTIVHMELSFDAVLMKDND